MDEMFLSMIEYSGSRALQLTISHYGKRKYIGFVKKCKWNQDKLFHPTNEHLSLDWNDWRDHILAGLIEFTERVDKSIRESAKINSQNKGGQSIDGE